MSPFFANKGFHPYISFLLLADPGLLACERIQAAKANSIVDKMGDILEFIKEQSTLN